MITIIAALAKNFAIGNQNKLLYWLPNDLKRFKQLTTNHTILMGRKTFESLPKGALPNRRNIVLSSSNKSFSGAETYPTLDQALSQCSSDEQVFIIGGAQVYQQTLALADRLCLTFIDDTPVDADAFFPSFSLDEWELIVEECFEKDEKHAHSYRFVDYKRKSK